MFSHAHVSLCTDAVDWVWWESHMNIQTIWILSEFFIPVTLSSVKQRYSPSSYPGLRLYWDLRNLIKIEIQYIYVRLIIRLIRLTGIEMIWIYAMYVCTCQLIDLKSWRSLKSFLSEIRCKYFFFSLPTLACCRFNVCCPRRKLSTLPTCSMTGFACAGKILIRAHLAVWSLCTRARKLSLQHIPAREGKCVACALLHL